NSTYGVIENVTINNLLGKEVLRVNTIINSSIIDMSELASGVYFVIVTINGKMYRTSFIKE
ncbi:MAG: T9SS type A sorting domain-containing protein, partial [Bacteroidia bacterium]